MQYPSCSAPFDLAAGAKRGGRGILACRLAIAILLGASSFAQQIGDQHAERMARGLEIFRHEVRRVLVDNCVSCHGGAQTMGGLDLTSRGSLSASGKVSDSSESSALIAVLRHQRQPFMPFGRDRLPDAKIAAIARWIDLGAPYDAPLDSAGTPPDVADSRFWSFRTLSEAPPPQVVDAAWPRTPLDRFMLARLEAGGIEPNAAAGRRALIRRASLNLLGLPPGPEQVEAFVADGAPDAYERVVEALLESPHYGERWARHWMDIARFAESEGYEEDYDRPFAYHYRDFLIKALNRDMPYDRFVRLQVAGDELEPENPLALIATGFMGHGPFPTVITESEFENARYDELDDMVGTLGTALLGLTVGCARCHDHKHDPISARDYYSLAAVFGRTTRTIIEHDLNPAKFRREKHAWESHRKELRGERGEIENQHRGPDFEAWLREGASGAREGAWRVLDIEEVKTSSLAQVDVLDDGSVLFTGDNVDFDRYTLVAELGSVAIRGLRVEALTHPALPFNGPGRSHDGKFLLGVLSAEARTAADPDAEPIELEFASARATDQLDADYSSVEAAINDTNARSGWAVSTASLGTDHAAIFELKAPAEFASGTKLVVKMHFAVNSHFSLGRLRLSVTDSETPEFAVGKGDRGTLADGLVALREHGAEALTSDQESALLRVFARSDEKWRAADEALRDHESRIPVPSFTKIQATAEGFAKPRHNSDGMGYPHFYEQTHVLQRGDPGQKVGPAHPGVLQALIGPGAGPERWQVKPPPGWERSRFQRAALAEWLTDADHGAGALLARVIVNRIWHHHFGTGIVATPSNFGAMGSRPSHPGLLDWLARDLIANGWRLKRLHRMIMTSSAYRLDSSSDPGKARLDPANRLRWRWTPRRLEAEAVRDSMLTAAGLLDPAMYGRGSQNESSNRRSIYFFVKRSQLIPSMMLFDWPEHHVGIGRRPSTTVAPQALLFLNSPNARRYAAGFSRRLGDLSAGAAIDRAYRIAYSRPPRPAEIEAGADFLQRQRRLYESHGERDAGGLAILDYCQSLMSLNEFLYIR